MPRCDDDPALVGAAVLVLEAVVGLGLVRALVVDVEDAVLVVVGIGAAVLVLEAVLVLGVVRAQVVDVEDAVLVVVGIGAAVLVLEAVLVLGIVGALVHVVGDAVAVAIVGRCCRGSRPRPGTPLRVSGSFGHLSSTSRMPSLVVVGLGAAVLVLEVVEVLGIVRALVDVVLVAVAVAVADRRLEDEADEQPAALGPTVVAQEAPAAAQLEERVAGQVQLDAGDRLHRPAPACRRAGSLVLSPRPVNEYTSPTRSNFSGTMPNDRPRPASSSLPTWTPWLVLRATAMPPGVVAAAGRSWRRSRRSCWRAGAQAGARR